MFEIREGIMKINDVVVDTFERDVVEEETVLTVEAGTTGYRGGDRRAGGRTVLRIANTQAADMYAEVTQNEKGYTKEVVIAFAGDNGLEAFMKALQFAINAYDDQRRGVDD